MAKLAAQNTPAGSVPFFVGAGAYKHHVPATVDHLIQRSEFLTSYTPYQPEIAQGTLQYLFEFQTQVAMLTGMEVANASMYDGSTAAAEAVLMAHRITKRHKAVLAGNLHPHYRETIETVSRLAEHEVVALPPAPAGKRGPCGARSIDTVSCVVVQTPDFYGHLHDLTALADKAHAVGALLIAVFTEAVSLGLVQPPGAMGADIVVGEGQSHRQRADVRRALRRPVRHAHRNTCGRCRAGSCGETVDTEGRRGFVLTLSTREQHIRREKATSNICTNSGLCVLAFTIHMTPAGRSGAAAARRASTTPTPWRWPRRWRRCQGVKVLNDTFFNEFTIRVPGDAADVIEKLAAKGVLGGVPVSRLEPGRPELADLIVVASTEINTDADRAAYATALKEVLA